MFMKKNLIKKASLVIASLALVIPLASMNATTASARHVRRHARVIRVYHHKRFGKRYNRHFNKRNYKRYNKRFNKRARKHVTKKHMRVGSYNSYNRRVNLALNRAPKNVVYNAGFNDALNAKVNHKLAHNANYEKGYLQIIALDNFTDPSGKQIPKQLSNGALKSAATYYSYCVLK